MNIQVEDVGPSRKQLTVEVPAETVSELFATLTKNYARQVRIPGFRPGKAPANLVRTRFRKEICEDAKERLIPKSYQQAIQQEKIVPLNVLDVSEGDPEDGKPFVFTATIEVFPEFALPDYKAIQVPFKKLEVTEEAVDDFMERMRERLAFYTDAPDRKAERGDQVMVNYQAAFEGQPLVVAEDHKVLAKAENFGVILDPDYVFIPEFVDGLIGVTAGERRTLTATFAPDFIVKNIAGKKVDYDVEVVKVQTKELPEWTPEFIKSFGVDSIDDMRSRFREDIARTQQGQEFQRVQSEIARQLVESTAMALPDSELQRATANEVYSLVQHNTERGVDKDAIENAREQIFADAGKTAEQRLRLKYILLKIAREESMVVTDQELDTKIRRDAMQSGHDPAKVRANLVKNHKIPDIREEMLAIKAMARLISTQARPAEEPAADAVQINEEVTHEQ